MIPSRHAALLLARQNVQVLVVDDGRSGIEVARALNDAGCEALIADEAHFREIRTFVITPLHHMEPIALPERPLANRGPVQSKNARKRWHSR